jgi:hypothetical protein
MSNLLPSALIGLVSGSVAAFAVVNLSGAPAASGPVSTRGGETAALSGTIEEQVAALGREQARMRDEFALHQSGVDQKLGELLARSTRVGVAAAEHAEGTPEAAAALVANELAASGAVLADPQFETAVAAAIERIEQREREEQDQARRQRELDQIEERLASMRTELGLDGFQETQMRTILIDNLDKATVLRDAMRNDTLTRDEMREGFTNLRTGLEEAVAGVLSPAQYEQFQEDFARQFGGMGGFGDRGFRGGGGPGGGQQGGGGAGGFTPPTGAAPSGGSW